MPAGTDAGRGGRGDREEGAANASFGVLGVGGASGAAAGSVACAVRLASSDDYDAAGAPTGRVCSGRPGGHLTGAAGTRPGGYPSAARTRPGKDRIVTTVFVGLSRHSLAFENVVEYNQVALWSSAESLGSNLDEYGVSVLVTSQ